MKNIFVLQNPPYSLRSYCIQFRKENIKTVHFGLESVRYLDPKIWGHLPNKTRYSNFLRKFKKLSPANQRHVPAGYVRNTFVAQVGLIQLSQNIQIFYQSRINL